MYDKYYSGFARKSEEHFIDGKLVEVGAVFWSSHREKYVEVEYLINGGLKGAELPKDILTHPATWFWGNECGKGFNFPLSDLLASKPEEKKMWWVNRFLLRGNNKRVFAHPLEESEEPAKTVLEIFDCVKVGSQYKDEAESIAMAIPWRRKVKNTVEGYISFNHDKSKWAAQSWKWNDDKPCIVTYEVEEEV